MGVDQTTKELFVRREKELDQFKHLLTPESKVNILSVHTNGDGGIGKTQLLLRMQKYRAEVPDDVVFAKELIDFYHTESRSRRGVLQQIVDNLGKGNFPGFRKLVQQYQETTDVSVREELFLKIETVFRKDYGTFSNQMKEQKKVIVLFFDTYEFIQGVEEILIEEQKQTEATEFSRWIETQLFPHITENTRIIVSGRYPLSEIDRSKFSVEEINLAHFALADTIEFWKKRFNVETDKELAEQIGSGDLIEPLHALANGRPILLALFADWVNYDRNPLSPGDLLNEIEQKIKKSIKPVTKKQLFEKVLIKRVASLSAPEDRAVTNLAVAYRRMTPEMFHFLTDVPLDECREILLERLKPLSFIKYKRGDVILLHDEMRRLVVGHWWNDEDPARSIRKTIARKLVEFYDNKLLAPAKPVSEADREIYTPELLEYAFLARPLDGLDRFRNEFNIAMEDGKYDYADLLLREAENYHNKHPDDILFPYFLRIRLRRIRYDTQTNRDYEESLRMANVTLEKYQGVPEWEDSVIRGHFLLSKGEAELWLGELDKAINSFQEAKTVFYDFGENAWMNRTGNWIGWAFFRRGDFNKAKLSWTQSQEGFSILLEEKGIDERERRRLIQGIQYSFGNLAIVDRHTGRFDSSINRAEILLNIVRHLPRNSKEIARARITVTQALEFAGRTVDARHHAVEVENLIKYQQIYDRVQIGRLKTNLGLLQYRTKELTYLLEYWRAEEIEKVVENLAFVQQKDIKKARELIEDAISIFGKEPVIKKELADAYYASGELYMVTPEKEHWQKAEKEFLKALEWGRKSQFLYRVVDTLEGLVALYYFWNGASEVSNEVKEQNRRKMRQYQGELDQCDKTKYPNLFGKYEVTLGDIKFDEAVELLRSENEKNLDSAMPLLKKAFTHYVSAAGLMKQFHEDRYYLTLRIFYNRLHTLIDIAQKENILPGLLSRLDELQSAWAGQSEEFQEIYQYVHLRIQPEKKLKNIHELQQKVFQNAMNEGNVGLASLLNDCLIGAYTSLSFLDKGSDEYREQLVLRLNAQSNLYRILGDEYQATRCILDARKELESISDSHLKESLEGFTDSREGTLKYRRGEYGRLSEFYLQGELNIGKKQFDAQFRGAREKALKLLQDGEAKLNRAISFWEEGWTQVNNVEEKPRLVDLIQQHRRNLGETRFRIGELLMLNEQFYDHDDQKGALSYLKEAINDSESSRDTYRYDYAVQSYINALYFSGNYDHPDHREERIVYEKRFEEKLKSSDAKIYPSIMGRLRITQGDTLFSSSFQRKEEFSQTGEFTRTYIPREGKVNTRRLRTILRHYIEACNFMAQHSHTNFAAAVRVLRRRIELLSDKGSLQEIQRCLRDVWSDQEHLAEKDEELETFIQFAKIRSMMLEDETTK